MSFSKVTSKALAKAGKRVFTKAPRNAAATSFRRYAKTVGTLGKDVLHVAGPAGLRVRRVAPNVLRGPAPATPEMFARLVKNHKVKTIISLLDPSNPKEIGLIELEKKMARKMGVELKFVSMPFGVHPPETSIAKFLSTVADKTKGQIYIHCRLGRDRTGTMVAVYRMAMQGVGPRKALAEMKSFGYNPVRDTWLTYLGEFVTKFGTAIQAKQPNKAAAVFKRLLGMAS